MLNWLLDWTRRPDSDAPGPLLRLPLTGTEMAAQTGLTLEHRQRLGLFPPDVVAAVDRLLLQEVDAELSVEPTRAAPVGEIFFKPGEPRTFEDYGGQTHITRLLVAVLNGLRPEEPVVLEPTVFSGVAGGGKTLLAKVTANEMRARAVLAGQPLTEFIEVFTSDVPTVEALDALMRRVVAAPGCVMFIDELHTLDGKEHWTKFLEVLENRRYKFESEAYPTLLPPFTILAATTDYGTLTEPWRRRFDEQRFERATYEQLLSYVQRRNVMPITDEAARAIVDRTHWGGAPWEALWVYRKAVIFAKERHSPVIDTEDVATVWTVNHVDELGLRPVDRDVLAALFRAPRHRRDRRTGEQEFVCYALSEDNVIQMARVDRAEYKDYIRPKLMNRGLLEIRISYGQALTPLAIEKYSWLHNPTTREH